MARQIVPQCRAEPANLCADPSKRAVYMLQMCAMFVVIIYVTSISIEIFREPPEDDDDEADPDAKVGNPISAISNTAVETFEATPRRRADG